MDCTSIGLSSPFTAPRSALQWPLIHPLAHQWAAAAVQGAARPIGRNLEFSVLPRDTATWTISARIWTSNPFGNWPTCSTNSATGDRLVIWPITEFPDGRNPTRLTKPPRPDPAPNRSSYLHSGAARIIRLSSLTYQYNQRVHCWHSLDSIVKQQGRLGILKPCCPCVQKQGVAQTCSFHFSCTSPYYFFLSSKGALVSPTW